MHDPALPLPKHRLPLLITGVSGVAGYNALDYFQKRYPGQVFGIRPSDTWRLVGPGVLGCDTNDCDAMKRLFDRHTFGSVLDCTGNCALKPCELNPSIAWRDNVESVQNLLRLTVPSGCRLVHLSVDLVYSGRGDGGYVEEDPTDPVTVYGKTMVAGEQAVLAADPGACILRMSLPMGVSFNGHAGAIDWIQSRFAKSRPATLYYDEIRTPTYTDCFNELCETVLAGDLAGIFHAGGPRRLSLYQIAQIVNRAGGYDPELLFGTPRFDAGPIPPRAGNVSMDSTKLIRALGYDPFDPWPLSDALVPTDRDWHRQLPAGEPGSPEFLHAMLAVNPRRRDRAEVA